MLNVITYLVKLSYVEKSAKKYLKLQKIDDRSLEHFWKSSLKVRNEFLGDPKKEIRPEFRAN